MVADGRPVGMHDLARLYADQLSEEHPQADGPEQWRRTHFARRDEPYLLYLVVR